ncbi:TPA: hypothetical protein ACH3X1_004532 [Trebouxia sp. C0004]
MIPNQPAHHHGLVLGLQGGFSATTTCRILQLKPRSLETRLCTCTLAVTQYFDHCGAYKTWTLMQGMQSAIAEALQKQFTHISATMHDYLRQAKDPMPAAAQATVADMRQKQHADALSAPKSRRPRGLAAAVGAPGFRPDSTSLASAPQSTPRPASSASTASSCSAVTQASGPSVTTTGNQDQSDADVLPHSNDSCSHMSGSASTSSSISNHITTSDIWSVESSSSSRVLGSGSGSGSRRSVTMAQLGAVMLDQLGYSLEVRTSGISHPDAGDGLWLRGTAPVGAVVGLYPGLVYEPMHYRRIPGYPKIDTHNDYFLACFDGALIDGQSWGRGRPTLGPTNQHVDSQYRNTHHAMLAQLHQKEMRHPLALAHYANHPAAGTHPNVMVAAFTYNPRQGEDAWLAAYMPNVMYHEAGGQEATEHAMQDQQTKGLVFVATRQIQDEEVLLNYRLNPQVQKPSWYAPVDEEEDKRRWY